MMLIPGATRYGRESRKDLIAERLDSAMSMNSTPKPGGSAGFFRCRLLLTQAI